MASLASADSAQLKAQVANEAKAMNNMEGNDEKGDLRTSWDNALGALKTMIPPVTKDDHTWEFRGVHLGEGPAAGKKMDEFLFSFLRWAQKPADRAAKSVNVSKAFRRLRTFAKYQETHADGWFATPVKKEECILPNKFFGMTILRENEVKSGSAIWIIDLERCEGNFDKTSFGLTDDMLMRWLWYTMICSIFDEVVQNEGVIIIQNLKNVGFTGFVKLSRASSSVETEMNKLFYGCCPFKMKECIANGSPWWINMLLGIMSLFLSKKMKERIKNMTVKEAVDHCGGTEVFPVGYLGGTGTQLNEDGSNPDERY